MRNKFGFTLMEMMVVIAIIGIISAGVIPNLISWRNNAQLSAASRQVYSDLQSARRTAIKNNETITINFGAADSYDILAQSGSVLAHKKMPPGITITTVLFNDLGNVASFNSFGFGRTSANADNTGDVTVGLAGGTRTSTIHVESGGSVRIQ